MNNPCEKKKLLWEKLRLLEQRRKRMGWKWNYLSSKQLADHLELESLLKSMEEEIRGEMNVDIEQALEETKEALKESVRGVVKEIMKKNQPIHEDPFEKLHEMNVAELIAGLKKPLFRPFARILARVDPAFAASKMIDLLMHKCLSKLTIHCPLHSASTSATSQPHAGHCTSDHCRCSQHASAEAPVIHLYFK